MKRIILITIVILVAITGNNVLGQKQKKTETFTVTTTAQCGMCKATLEKAMAYEKGVVSSSLDVETAKFTITYKSHKTNPEKLRTAISKTGYAADDVKAEESAYNKLPTCCKVGGMDHK